MLHFLDPPEEFHPLTREDPSAFSPPPAFGPFRVLHQVGVGALGPVFRTYEPTRDRLVAVKAFRLDIVPEQAQALAEALSRATEAGLFHPSIVEPIAAGVEGTVAYRAEEYVAAESLDVAMRHYAPAPIEKALPFITQLAGAIDFARAAGVGHGGLHPRDIFVTPDEARATGFGVVEALESVGLRAPIRRPYSAPERIDGGSWSTPADVFALAAIAYELLTARRPAGTGVRIGPPPEVDHADAIQAVLARAMGDDPSRRFGSALAFAGALESAARGQLATDAVSAIAAIAGPQATAADRAADHAAHGAADHAATDHTDHTDHGATDHAAADLTDHAGLARPPAEEGSVFAAPAPGSEAPEPSLLFEPEPEPEPLEPLERLEPFSEPTEPEPMEPMEPVEPEEPSFDEGEPSYATRDFDLGAEPERTRPAVLPMAVMLVLGLLVGFGAGYFVRDRSVPAAAAREVTEQPVAQAPTARAAGDGAALMGPPSVVPPSQRSAEPPPAVAEPSPGVTVPPRATPPPAETRPAPAGEEAPAASVAKRGRVEVRSTPSRAGVTVNGTWRGRTPLTLENLAFGKYVIRIVQPGYRVAREEFTLGARSALKTIDSRLEREAPARRNEPEGTAGQPSFSGTLYVDSRPQGANVLLDGKLVGKTPLRLPDVKVGTHVVRIELAEHKPWSSTTRVVSGQEARVTGSLERFQ